MNAVYQLFAKSVPILLIEDDLDITGDGFACSTAQQLYLFVGRLCAQHLQRLLESLLDGFAFVLQHHVPAHQTGLGFHTLGNDCRFLFSLLLCVCAQLVGLCLVVL